MYVVGRSNNYDGGGISKLSLHRSRDVVCTSAFLLKRIKGTFNSKSARKRHVMLNE